MIFFFKINGVHSNDSESNNSLPHCVLLVVAMIFTLPQHCHGDGGSATSDYTIAGAECNNNKQSVTTMRKCYFAQFNSKDIYLLTQNAKCKMKNVKCI